MRGAKRALMTITYPDVLALCTRQKQRGVLVNDRSVKFWVQKYLGLAPKGNNA